MVTFYLYRLKIEWVDQESRDKNEREPGEIILSAIKEKPSQETGRGQIWRIGNIKEVARKKVFFALGKVTKTTGEFYDESRKDFIAKYLEEAPHTHVAIDLNLQVCAIAQKTKIAPNIRAIARNLSILLNASREVKTNKLTFNLVPIYDPEEFLNSIKNAVRITEFEMTLSQPNPFDEKRQIRDLWEKLARDVNGNRGKISVFPRRGKTLKGEGIAKYVQSGISVGDKVKARIQSKPNEKPVLKKMKESQIVITTEEPRNKEQILHIFKEIEEAYYRVRGRDN